MTPTTDKLKQKLSENIKKATHCDVELWQPIIQSELGKYIAILSDDSVDRYDEIIGKQALQSIMDDDGYVVALMDHENKILNQVAEWTNKRIEQIDGHNALVAEPKFYESNPNAKIIMGMLNEGAKLGVSIGAMVKASEEQEVEGTDRKRTVYTDLELVEASFVAIPANRHGRAMAVAKGLKLDNDTGGVQMEKTYTEKEFDALKKELEDAKSEVEEAEAKVTEAEAKVEEVEAAKEDVENKFSATEKELKDLKKIALHKSNNAVDEDQNADAKKTAEQEIKKAIESGALPVMSR